MDPSFNSANEEIFEDNIRPPDKVKRDQLLDDYFTNENENENENENDNYNDKNIFEKETEDAIYLSLYELNEQQKKNKAYEDEIIDRYLNETNQRREKFRELLEDMNKISKYDKELKEIYDIIEPIIDLYCNQYIEFYDFDTETYAKIFKIMGTLRNSKQKIELLKTIIIQI